MRRCLKLVAVGLLVGTGCAREEAPKLVAAKLPLQKVGDWLLGEPVQYANMTIFPLLAPTPKTDDRFITLDEGLKNGTVEIMEVGAATHLAQAPSAHAEPRPARPPVAPQPAVQPPAAGHAANAASTQTDDAVQEGQAGDDVNHLMVVNRSTKALYLMPGEIVLGGQQDRTVGDEMVIQPTTKPVSIEVFCVEHGRWQGRSVEQDAGAFANLNGAAWDQARSANGSADLALKLTKEANAGKFVASPGAVSKETRQAVQRNGDDKQSKVWDKVQAAVAKSGVKPDDFSENGTFVGNYTDEESAKRLVPYIEKLKDPIAGAEQVVGVVVAINGKVESLDAFESTPLFLKLWPKLLKSYALDAANAADPKLKNVACPSSAVCQFVEELQARPAESRRKRTKGKSRSRPAPASTPTASRPERIRPEPAWGAGPLAALVSAASIRRASPNDVEIERSRMNRLFWPTRRGPQSRGGIGGRVGDAGDAATI